VRKLTNEADNRNTTNNLQQEVSSRFDGNFVHGRQRLSGVATSRPRRATGERLRDNAHMKLHSLADLKTLKQLLSARAAAAAAEREAQRQQAIRTDREQRLFELAVGPVRPLADKRRVVHPPRAVSVEPLQRQRDEQSVMREALSDEFDVETLLHIDDMLSYRTPGLGADVVRKLREGRWSIQRQLDLHGLRVDQAREALGRFIRESQHAGLRCVRVVHGKGLGSPGRTPVLKSRVHRWLVQKQEVMAFVQARPADGGAGALVVLLRPA
jgi:DNA-nicking Smr family endonuclease